jgi:hypothetical protein
MMISVTLIAVFGKVDGKAAFSISQVKPSRVKKLTPNLQPLKDT